MWRFSMCGVVGIAAFDEDRDDIASWISWALVELEHRGKEASGIGTNQGLYKDRGTPEQVFNQERLRRLGGNIGLGHVLYTTSGKTMDEESLRKRAQPFDIPKKNVSFVFNGNLINWQSLRDDCIRRGYTKEIINDAGVIAALIDLAENDSLEEILMQEVLPRLQWSFSIVFYDRSSRVLYGARDPYGFMPLVMGRREDEFLVIASEDCIFDKGSLNCTWIGEVPIGSIVCLDPSRKKPISTKKWVRRIYPKHCIFHSIYFNRPETTFYGRNMKMIQQKSGNVLAQKYPVDNVDSVVPVRDSGLAAAQGYAEVMTQKTGRWLFDCFGLSRPHTVGRTFMEPHQKLREEGVGKKHRVIPEVVKGKVIVVVDDSLVRGTTMKRLIERLLGEGNGAQEVHVRIASPPIKGPCYYGIDVPTHEELAWNYCGQSKESIREFIGASSLEYLDDVGDNIRAVLETEERYPYPLDENSFCTQCFTGLNPIKD